MHNVLNALSAIAVARRTERPRRRGAARRWPSSTASAAASRATATRRAGRARRRQFTLIDDYGHHPVEMAATLAAARGAFPGRRLVLAFQPHRYTRTRDCFEDFVKVLGQADAVLLAEVYAAGEAPIVAADGRSLARAVRVAGKVEPVFVDDIADMPQAHAGHRARRRRGACAWAPARSAACRPSWSSWDRRSRASAQEAHDAVNVEDLRQGRRADGRPFGRARSVADVRQRRAGGAAVAGASMRTPSTRPSATWSNSSAKASSAASSRCTAASAKTARCRARWSCWAFPTPAPA